MLLSFPLCFLSTQDHCYAIFFHSLTHHLSPLRTHCHQFIILSFNGVHRYLWCSMFIQLIANLQLLGIYWLCIYVITALAVYLALRKSFESWYQHLSTQHSIMLIHLSHSTAHMAITLHNKYSKNAWRNLLANCCHYWIDAAGTLLLWVHRDQLLWTEPVVPLSMTESEGGTIESGVLSHTEILKPSPSCDPKLLTLPPHLLPQTAIFFSYRWLGPTQSILRSCDPVWESFAFSMRAIGQVFDPNRSLRKSGLDADLR